MIENKTERLTKDEELKLGKKIQQMKALKLRVKSGYDALTDEEQTQIFEGDIALEKLVDNYYDLARKLAHDHHKKTGTRYSIEDLLQDAISALVDAAYAYDPEKNCKLGTYAFYGITKRVSSTINYQRLVRLPENKMGEYIVISNAKKEYHELTETQKEEYDGELDFVYNNVGDLKKKEVDIILDNMQPQVSLNADIYDGSAELMDLLKDDKAEAEVIELGNLDESITSVVEALNDYEQDLIAFEFGAYPASMAYSDFLIKYEITDKKVKFETKKAIRKMRKIAEKVGK